ncbi:MAG: hypothetical protein ABH846_04185 [Patescibacteria group bacterium]
MDERKSPLIKRSCGKCKEFMAPPASFRSVVAFIGLFALVGMAVAGVFIDISDFRTQQYLAIPFLIILICAPIALGLQAFERKRRFKCRHCGYEKIERYKMQMNARRILEFVIFIISVLVVPLVIAGTIGYYFFGN